MANDKPGVMIYFETARAVKGLDYETKGRLFDAIMEYAEDGVVPAFDGVLSAVWPFIAEKIDRDSVRYTDIVNKRTRAQYVRWWNEHAKKNGIDPDNELLREQWIDKQMNTKNTNVSGVIQTIPTTTTTATATATSTATTAGASTAGAGNSPTRAYGCCKNVFLTEDEFAELCTDIPNAGNVIEKLSLHMKSSGKTYADHAATVRKWAMEDAEKKRTEKLYRSGNPCDDITMDDYKKDSGSWFTEEEIACWTK